MDEAYKDIGDPFECLTEECAELILALCKMTRFGYYNYNPYDPHQKPNWKSILEEIGDVEYRIAEVKVLIEINRRAN